LKSCSQVKAERNGQLRGELRSLLIREGLGVELRPICIEGSWFGHLVRMPSGHLPREVSDMTYQEET